MRKPATCHPDKQQHAYGLCNACYNKSKGYGVTQGESKLAEKRAKEEAERIAWRVADMQRLNPQGLTVKDEEIMEVMREDISRGRGYRRYLGKWASNDEN